MGEDLPLPEVHRLDQKGRFSEPLMSYEVRYERADRRHNFTVIVDGRRADFRFPVDTFPNLRVSEMRVYPSSRASSELNLSLEYGEPADCEIPTVLREGLVFSVNEGVSVDQVVHDGCQTTSIRLDAATFDIRLSRSDAPR